jgi:PAS domain S-box-containing protein
MSDPRSSPARSTNPLGGRAESADPAGRGDIRRMSPEEIERLVHELRSHQVELEVQNEEFETLEQRVAERTEEVRLLGEAVSHLAEGVVITSDGLEWPGPRIVFVNDAMCRITGYAAEELVGRTPRLLQGPATDRSVIARMRAELAAGHHCQVEVVNYRKDGTAYPAEMFITPIVDPVGKHTHYVSIHRDISERKQAEDALTTLGRIVEESLNEIYIIDAATLKFLQVNRGGRENLGYTMEELRGLTPLDLKPSFDQAAFDALVAPLRSGEVGKVVFESRYRRKDGTYYDVEVALQPTDYRGTSCIVAIALDTTRRKELEQEVVKASEEERQRIANDLHDDLGSQLTGLKLHIESFCHHLAAKRELPEEGCETILNLVREAIGRTREIARGLRPVGNDPEDLMGSFRGMAERTELASGMACRFECATPVLIADPHVANHLYRIAQEAVNNAVKHSGGTRITISMEDSGPAIELRVMHDGSGFKRSPGQGGLGLHIMNYRAEAMKGALHIGPVETGGTCIRCVVPKAAPAP